MAKSAHSTLKTIASEAGVTANTVSLALRDSPLIAYSTKQRIIDIAQQQGYVHNALAGSLRSGRSRTIALAFSDLSSPLYAMKMKMMEKELRLRGYQALILCTNDEPEQEYEVLRAAVSRKVDGVVLCPCQKGRKALDFLRQYKIPCCLVGRSYPDDPEDTVIWNNEEGAYIATRYLLDQGCRHILCMKGSDFLSTSHDRFRGHIRALEEAGLPIDPRLQCTPDDSSIPELLQNIEVPFDGVFAFNDLQAWETACYVSPDLPIVGFDNMQNFMALPFHIPSIAADLDSETHYVVDLLLERIEHPDRERQRIVLPMKLVFH